MFPNPLRGCLILTLLSLFAGAPSVAAQAPIEPGAVPLRLGEERYSLITFTTSELETLLCGAPPAATAATKGCCEPVVITEGDDLASIPIEPIFGPKDPATILGVTSRGYFDHLGRTTVTTEALRLCARGTIKTATSCGVWALEEARLADQYQPPGTLEIHRDAKTEGGSFIAELPMVLRLAFTHAETGAEVVTVRETRYSGHGRWARRPGAPQPGKGGAPQDEVPIDADCDGVPEEVALPSPNFFPGWDAGAPRELCLADFDHYGQLCLAPPTAFKLAVPD